MLHEKLRSLYESKLRRCFHELSVSNLLQNNTFWLKVKSDVANTLSVLHSVIPDSIETGHKSVCWNTTFIMELGIDGILSGKIGKHKVYVEFNNSRDFADPRKYYKLLLQEKSGITNGVMSSFICIPRVFLAGFPKSGSTAFDDMLTIHPKIKHGISKEPRWWAPPALTSNSNRFKPTKEYFIKYVLQYLPFAIQAQKDKEILLIDSSPNLLASWSNIGFGEQFEDICVLPVVISLVISNPQFIVILRDPIEFLYSTFWFRCSSKVYKNYNLTSIQVLKGPQVFHSMVLRRLGIFSKCRLKYTTELCVLAQTYIKDEHSVDFPCGVIPIHHAIYYVHILKWLSVIQRQNFYFITYEEYFQKPFEVTRDIWDFLSISQPHLNYTVWGERLQRGRNSQVKYNYRNNLDLQMLPQTRIILKEFFKPFNNILSTLLGSDKYLWNY